MSALSFLQGKEIDDREANKCHQQEKGVIIEPGETPHIGYPNPETHRDGVANISKCFHLLSPS